MCQTSSTWQLLHPSQNLSLPCSRYLSATTTIYHTMLSSVAWWDKNGRIPKTRTNWNSKRENRVSYFEKPAFFHIHHSKGFWETTYLSKKITITIHTHGKHAHTNSTHMYNLSQVKVKFIFLGNKKRTNKRFSIWKFGNWLSIFL